MISVMVSGNYFLAFLMITKTTTTADAATVNGQKSYMTLSILKYHNRVVPFFGG